jgi:hypothetical protein
MTFFKYCKNCENKFIGTKYQRFCLKCLDLIQRQNRIKINEARRKWQEKQNDKKR